MQKVPSRIHPLKNQVQLGDDDVLFVDNFLSPVVRHCRFEFVVRDDQIGECAFDELVVRVSLFL